MKFHAVIKIFVSLLFLQETVWAQQSNSNPNVQGIWNGTVRYVEKGSTTLGTYERIIDVVITQNKVSGTHKYAGKHIIENKVFDETVCEGTGDGELHSLGLNTEAGTYTFEIISPECKGTHKGMEGTEAYGPETISIVIADKQLGKNYTILTGSETTSSDGLGTGTITASTTWSLTRTSDAELIVTPQNYDNWLPEPGKDELTKGSVMNILLKVQGKNGKPSSLKAKYFELRLSNTSKEPGITINAPVNPDKPIPDLRFLPQSNGEEDDELQFIKISSIDGVSGKAVIAAYDGGGWTTLSATAIMEDNSRIQGSLFVSGGITDIPIPKRDPKSHIAEAWLKTNGNPGEKDDEETTKDNSHNGDGLTAYEEYRGVISLGKYKRLDPTKKEVGIRATKNDFSLFNEGIGWFENASELTPVRFDFDRDETAPDGKLNMNSKSAHIFDQFAIYIFDGGAGGDGTLGVTYYKHLPSIPANDIGVIIDWNYIQKGYQESTVAAKPGTLKFTLQEYLAQTVAHELGHAVNIRHHGRDNPQEIAINPADLIFYRSGSTMTGRSLTLKNVGDSTGTVEGGNMSCMLNYYPYFSWAHTVRADGVNIYTQEPLLSIGRIFCKAPNGTGINATGRYFGNAGKERGDCFGQIQLKN